MFDTLTRMGAAGAGSAYEIERSLRFEGNKGNSGGVSGGASGQLDRDYQAGGNPEKWTFACWFKRSSIGTTSYQNSNNVYHFIGPYRGGDGSQESVMGFDSSDRFYMQDSSNSTLSLISHRRFRDISAWMHIVVAVDTTQGTAGNRVKVYFNGEQYTDWSTETQPSQNYDMGWNKEHLHAIGRYAYPGPTSGALTRWSGYFAEMYWIDDQQLTPSSFGETNADTGEFVPIEYEGTYGTTGWYLDFSDNSNTTSSTLGKDRSGNNNDWTPANFSVASNNTTDSVPDTPTNNYATLNRICGRDGYFAEISDGALHTHLINGSYYQFAVATQSITSGKYYWEVTVDDSGTAGDDTKAAITVVDMDTSTQNGTPDWKRRIYYRDGEAKVSNAEGGTKAAYGASWTDGDVIGVALDMSAGTLTMYKNGTSQGVLDDTMLTNLPDGGWFPACAGYASPNFTFNFGQQPFAHTPPAGHGHLCTGNMPASQYTIKDPSKHFNIELYTGNDSDGHARTGLGFQPNLVCIKDRGDGNHHRVYDSVRGVNAALITSADWDEDQYATYGQFESFDSDGFTVGIGTGTSAQRGEATNSAEPHVAWCWKASATAGFEIVSYEGTGSSRAVSHTLGVKPEMIIIKNRDDDENWIVYHAGQASDPETDYLILNDGSGIGGDDTWLNDTPPTNSQWEYSGGGNSYNANGDNYIAYVFASIPGFSKIGTYKGTGDTEGPYIYTGFRPAYILTKRVETTPNAYWNIFDSARDPHNSKQTASYKRLLAHSSGAEATNHSNYTPPEFFSNGFRIIHGSADKNYDNKRFVYIAFAESPFKYANAR